MLNSITYQAFTAGLRQVYGRLPSAGIPRVIPLKNKSGRREFIIVDPGGNWIRIGQIIETLAGNEDAATSEDKAASTKLTRALHVATLLSDVGHDDRAAKMLDAALDQDEPTPTTQRVPALVFRAGLAITLGDLSRARSILLEARQLPLRDDDRDTLVAELERADELEHLLQ